MVHATMVYSAPGVGACTMAVRLAPLGACRTTGTWLGVGVGVGFRLGLGETGDRGAEWMVYSNLGLAFRLGFRVKV